MDKKMKEKKIVDCHDNVEGRVYYLEKCMTDIERILEKIETKLDAGFIRFDAKIDRLEDKLDNSFRDIRKEIKSDFKWLMGMVIGLAGFTVSGLIGVATLMAHGFHWIQ